MGNTIVDVKSDTTYSERESPGQQLPNDVRTLQVSPPNLDGFVTGFVTSLACGLTSLFVEPGIQVPSIE
jgi:hypothetical protein